jgi:NAD(P)-dependent dehydrogenase (short-subunit alcohol dehydrogenase family)
MSRLTEKVAIVTGGGTGIGEAISKKFAKEGASVLVAGLPGDPVDEVVAEITKAGGQAIGFTGNIALQD